MSHGGRIMRRWRIAERLDRELEKEIEKTLEALGKPRITLSIEIPEGLEDMEGSFRELAHDEGFISDVRELARRYLEEKRRALAELFGGSDVY